MIPNIGPMEIGILLIVALIVFGPKRVPELGSSLGKGIRGFGKGIKGEDDDQAVLTQGDAGEDVAAPRAIEPETADAQGRAIS